MKISIVTPILNMVDYVNQTLRSVLNQEGVDIEYIVVDGGSTDGSLEILDRYKDRLTDIIRQSGQGQYAAIREGFARSSGDILAWINADDIYLPWTFSLVSQIFSTIQEVDWIIGLPSFINDKGQCIKISSNVSSYPREFIKKGWYRSHFAGYLQQESMFWRRSLWEKSGGLDLNYQYASDFHLWTKFAQHADLVSVSVPLAAFRIRGRNQISVKYRDRYEAEVEEVCHTLPNPPAIWRIMGRSGIVARSLTRMAIWKKCWVIAYCKDSQRWVQIKSIRPLSRASLSELMLEKALIKPNTLK